MDVGEANNLHVHLAYVKNNSFTLKFNIYGYASMTSVT